MHSTRLSYGSLLEMKYVGVAWICKNNKNTNTRTISNLPLQHTIVLHMNLNFILYLIFRPLKDIQA